MLREKSSADQTGFFQPQAPRALGFIIFIASYLPSQIVSLPHSEQKGALKGVKMQVGPGVRGGPGTANTWAKYSNSPSLQGTNLFQMNFKPSISWGCFFLLGLEILRNPDGLMLLGVSHSPVGRTRN